jgi:hypothetical protein
MRKIDDDTIEISEDELFVLVGMVEAEYEDDVEREKQMRGLLKEADELLARARAKPGGEGVESMMKAGGLMDDVRTLLSQLNGGEGPASARRWP